MSHDEDGLHELDGRPKTLRLRGNFLSHDPGLRPFEDVIHDLSFVAKRILNPAGRAPPAPLSRSTSSGGQE